MDTPTLFITVHNAQGSQGLAAEVGRTILVDTGVGPSSLGMATWLGRGGHSPDRLRAAGVSPEEVGTVMFTESLAGVAGAYVEQTLTPLKSLGVLDLADGERGLTEEVTASTLHNRPVS